MWACFKSWFIANSDTISCSILHIVFKKRPFVSFDFVVDFLYPKKFWSPSLQENVGSWLTGKKTNKKTCNGSVIKDVLSQIQLNRLHTNFSEMKVHLRKVWKIASRKLIRYRNNWEKPILHHHQSNKNKIEKKVV